MAATKRKPQPQPRRQEPEIDENFDDLEDKLIKADAPIPEGARIISDKEAKDLVDTYIYRPGRQDRGWTKMNGIEFHAGKEVKIPRTKCVVATVRQLMHLVDGSVVSRGVETRIPMFDLLSGNPAFCVNGVEPTPRAKLKSRAPVDPNTYRSYAIEWIGRAQSAVELESRWRGEEQLRERIGVDEHELQHIMPFYEIRHDVLKGEIESVE